MYGNFCLVLISKRKHMQEGNTLSVDYNLMDYQNGERKTISHVAR